MFPDDLAGGRGEHEPELPASPYSPASLIVASAADLYFEGGRERWYPVRTIGARTAAAG
jgi:hypothetical protein